MLLSSLYPLEKINTLVKTSAEWHPFPKGAERAAWAELMQVFQATHTDGVKIIAKAVVAMKSHSSATGKTWSLKSLWAKPQIY